MALHLLAALSFPPRGKWGDILDDSEVVQSFVNYFIFVDEKQKNE